MFQPIDYQTYLASGHWQARKAEAIRKAGYRCQYPGCKAYNVLDVHHLTYQRLGCELDSDIIVLCREHHQAIHEGRGNGI